MVDHGIVRRQTQLDSQRPDLRDSLAHQVVA
jgi:hypothetical protein